MLGQSSRVEPGKFGRIISERRTCITGASKTIRKSLAKHSLVKIRKPDNFPNLQAFHVRLGRTYDH